MAVIAPFEPDFDGQQLVWIACAAGGDQVQYDRRRTILIRNDDASSKTVTISVEAAVLGNTVPNRAIVVPNGQYYTMRMGQENVVSATGMVGITYSAVTNLWIAVMQAPL